MFEFFFLLFHYKILDYNSIASPSEISTLVSRGVISVLRTGVVPCGK